MIFIKSIYFIILLCFIFCSSGCNNHSLNNRTSDRGIIINQEVDERLLNIDNIGNTINDVIKPSTSNPGYYELYFRMDDIRFNIGYSVFIVNNNISKIYDNMKGMDTFILKSNLKFQNLKDKTLNFSEEEKNKLREEILKNKQFIVKILDEEYLYIIEEDKLVYSIEVEYTDPTSGNLWLDHIQKEL